MDTHRLANRPSWQTRRSVRLLAFLGSAMLLSALVATHLAAREPEKTAQKAPELTGIDHWINSDGLKLADLKGKVVVLHIWTFGCINCQHNLPYYNKWQTEFAKSNVRIIGVHTPETKAEADLKNVQAEVKKLKIEYPVAVDGKVRRGPLTTTASGRASTSSTKRDASATAGKASWNTSTPAATKPCVRRSKNCWRNPRIDNPA